MTPWLAAALGFVAGLVAYRVVFLVLDVVESRKWKG